MASQHRFVVLLNDGRPVIVRDVETEQEARDWIQESINMGQFDLKIRQSTEKQENVPRGTVKC